MRNLERGVRNSIFLLIIITGITAAAFGQVCGGYDVRVSVYDGHVHGPVDGLTFQIVPLGEDELKGKTFTLSKSNLYMEFSEADVIRGKYELVLNAPGYATSKKVVEFPHCSRSNFYSVPMFHAGEKRNMVSGHIRDQNQSGPFHPRITFTGADGFENQAETDLSNNYDIKLKPGKYIARVDHYDHLPFQRKLTVPENGNVVFNVKLKYVKPPPSKETFMLSGKITNYKGKGVLSDILIKDANGVNVNRMISWSDGTYSVELFNGTYTIEVERSEYGRSVPIRVTGGGGIPQTLDIKLPGKKVKEP